MTYIKKHSFFGRLVAFFVILSFAVAAFMASPAQASPASSDVKSCAPGTRLVLGTECPEVKQLQNKLLAQDLLVLPPETGGKTTNRFGLATLAAVMKWERSNGWFPDGIITVGSRQWEQMMGGTSGTPSAPKAAPKQSPVPKPASTPCPSKGKCIDVNMTSRTVTAYENGKVIQTLDARFGNGTTVKGKFTVVYKADKAPAGTIVSYKYGNTPMPWALSLSGGHNQLIHYSANFAGIGWSGFSKGCVNLRSWSAAQWLWRWAPTGTVVIIH